MQIIGLFFRIDATDTQRLCKFVNDEKQGGKACNAVMKLKVYNKYPRLCLFATRDILQGEEIRYDYGDDSVSWRQIKVRQFKIFSFKHIQKYFRPLKISQKIF